MERVIENIKQIYIEKGIETHHVTEHFIQIVPSAQITYIDNYSYIPRNVFPQRKNFAFAKKSLVLAENKGSFIREFYIHPSLKGNPIYSINHSIGCLYHCRYCYLQAYQDYPALIQFVNLERIAIEIEQIMQKYPHRTHFFSSGIMSDSLLFDQITRLCFELFPIFNDSNKAKLEIRTRTNNIAHLLDYNSGKNNIIVTWSLSPDEIIRNYEPGTPSLHQRIEAAARCQRSGYTIGFHLDPLIHYHDWKRGYRSVIKLMKELLDAESIQYIFLGSFRYKLDWAKVFRKRFGNRNLLLDEFVLSSDGKFRYFKPIRLEMYCTIAAWIEDWFPDIALNLAMESPEVWQKWQNCRASKRG